MTHSFPADCLTDSSNGADAFLCLQGLSIRYDTPGGKVEAVRDVSLSLERGQVGCLLGPSGCGKTTILRAIAGFEPVCRGSLSLGGKRLSSSHCHVPPEARRIGLMFQDYALFPHMTVGQNIGFGVRGVSKEAREARVHEMLDVVHLKHVGKRYPHELSGGQQQRVALARALASAPDLLLLDEPFSNLDVNTREHLASEVRNIIKDMNHTAIVVTHNQDEAFAIADWIGVMKEGGLLQWATPDAIQLRPAGDFVRQFLAGELAHASIQ